MYIYNAKIYTMDGEPLSVIERGFVRVLNGKIAEVSYGEPEYVSDGDIDCGGRNLYPGFIDAHTHLGILCEGEGDAGLNDVSDPVTPHLRTIDGLNFRDGGFADAVSAGITTVVTGVGSANPIGGDFIAVKTCGKSADDMLIRRVGIKFALGENPEKTYKDKSPQTRMATAAVIREALTKTRLYSEKNKTEITSAKQPEYDVKLDALTPLLERKLKAFFHCHRADDIMTALRISKEFNLDYALLHCTEGYAVADMLAAEKANVIAGPVISGREKRELTGHTVANAGILHKSGVKLAICTDHSELPIQYLCAGAAYSVKTGLPREEALRAITINAAEIAGIADRTGSITVGKDADFTLIDGDPLVIMSNVVMTVIEGKAVYRLSKPHVENINLTI